MTRAPIFLLIEPTIQNRPRYSSLAAWAQRFARVTTGYVSKPQQDFEYVRLAVFMAVRRYWNVCLYRPSPAIRLNTPCGIDPTARTSGDRPRAGQRFRI